MNFLIRRLIYFFPVSLSVVFLVGVLVHTIPGDPVDVIAGDFASESSKTEIRKKLGLDQPLSTQILSYYSSLLRGDLGQSLISRRPVSHLIRERAVPTLELAITSILISFFLSVPLGALCAIWPKSWLNFFTMGATYLSASMPTFWLGPLMILLFSVHLGWFPVSGRTQLSSLILPVLVLSSGLAAALIRMSKISFQNQIREDYVRTARSKGLNEFQIFFKHILKNSGITLTTLIGLQFGAIVTGTLITERVFDWPGLGTLIAEAIEQRDYPVIQGCVFIFSVAFLLTNLMTDLVYGWIDPRIKNENSNL